MTHAKYLDSICHRLGGISVLKKVQYELIEGNSYKIAKKYDLPMMDIRYLLSPIVQQEIVKYLYEQEHGQVLRIVWSNVA